MLERHGLLLKHRLGQNFLVSDAVIGRILALAELGSDDVVYEVGPGIGTLTVGLLATGANVVAIERDSDLPPVLAQTTGEVLWDDAPRFALVNMDALEVDEGVLCDAAARLEHPGLPRKLVANLPYAVAATIVLDYFQRFDFIDTMCVMVQAEVANRMCAAPGTKDYGAYSVKMALLAQPAGSFAVSPQSFLPPPRVESTVIRLDRRREGMEPGLAEAACLMADAAFHQRRKTIRNSMGAYLEQQGYPKALVDELLAETGIDPRSRGEAHAPDEFIALGEAFLKARVQE